MEVGGRQCRFRKCRNATASRFQCGLWPLVLTKNSVGAGQLFGSHCRHLHQPRLTWVPPSRSLLCTLCNLSLVQSAPGTLRCCWMSSVCLKPRKIAVLMEKNLWSTGTSLWINSSRASLKRIYLFPQPPRRWPQRTKHSVTLDERGSTERHISFKLCPLHWHE